MKVGKSAFLSMALLCSSALAATAAPPNDNFAQQPLPGLEGRLNGTTVLLFKATIGSTQPPTNSSLLSRAASPITLVVRSRA